MNSVNESPSFSDLHAVFLNCTLKRSPERSHTQGLIDISRAIMRKHGVAVESLRPVDYDIARGVYPDMTVHGWERDQWPQIVERVMAADIGSPIWLGEKSSVCTLVIKRLYASSGDLNEHGQYAYYGRVGGCLITGNEHGAKHCSMNISTRSSIWAIPSRHRPTPAGWERRDPARPISTPAPAVLTTTSPIATPPS